MASVAASPMAIRARRFDLVSDPKVLIDGYKSKSYLETLRPVVVEMSSVQEELAGLNNQKARSVDTACNLLVGGLDNFYLRDICFHQPVALKGKSASDKPTGGSEPGLEADRYEDRTILDARRITEGTGRRQEEEIITDPPWTRDSKLRQPVYRISTPEEIKDGKK